MSENFLSRWSKRKHEVRAQEKLAEQPTPPQPKLPTVGMDAVPVATTTGIAEAQQSMRAQPAPEPQLPLPTEADLLAVQQGGDIKAFMAEKVSTELKNKAFKALFSRPEFNVMDGLDIYIDDYNKFTPLSKEDIGKMTLSKQLLSRPDLEIPKISDMEQGLQRLEKLDSEIDAPGDSDVAVLDKSHEADLPGTHETIASSDLRVIPDGLQGDDLNAEFKKQPLEKSGGE
ncbi:MAG: DUF3306 domain-containing protein [Limnobacter sp.]